MTTLGLPVMESSGQVCAQFQIMPPTPKTAEEKSHFFFSIFKNRCDVKAGGPKTNSVLRCYRYTFIMDKDIIFLKKEKKRMFQVFTKGWSLKAVIFFNGYLWLHSILWDLCIPALSHPVPQKKTCSAAIKAAYFHRSPCSFCGVL